MTNITLGEFFRNQFWPILIAALVIWLVVAEAHRYTDQMRDDRDQLISVLQENNQILDRFATVAEEQGIFPLTSSEDSEYP